MISKKKHVLTTMLMLQLSYWLLNSKNRSLISLVNDIHYFTTTLAKRFGELNLQWFKNILCRRNYRWKRRVLEWESRTGKPSVGWDAHRSAGTMNCER